MPLYVFLIPLLPACCVFLLSIQAVVIAGKDKGPPLKLDLDITSEDLERKLRECLASRGRKATDPKVSTQYSILRIALATKQSMLDTGSSILNTRRTKVGITSILNYQRCRVDFLTLRYVSSPSYVTLRYLTLSRVTLCYIPCVASRYPTLPCVTVRNLRVTLYHTLRRISIRSPQDVLRQLSVLAYIARRLGPVREIPIIMYLVSAMFDTLRNIDEYMETAMWKSCRGYINRVSWPSKHSRTLFETFLTSLMTFFRREKWS